MKSENKRTSRKTAIRIFMIGIVCAGIMAALWNSTASKAAGPFDPVAKIYERTAPSFDLNLSQGLGAVRVPTGEQLTALANFKTAVG
jgi:hypothetical protein